jgi:hypothetical protein
VTEVGLPDPEELEERRDKAFSRRVALTTPLRLRTADGFGLLFLHH